ncbi:hypothetical protein Salmuc_05111 [Salipiger mucosus DSM 16094]|uniref:Uncharacterized protein n=1 Tax=Salipiger mucosus DSM 16094 TaxID=1123237 RepID=S9RTP0_9RHOB|nr:hypothetical protein Salmuc_05111 [Salipiger mucosus DSM 16094]
MGVSAGPGREARQSLRGERLRRERAEPADRAAGAANAPGERLCGSRAEPAGPGREARQSLRGSDRGANGRSPADRAELLNIGPAPVRRVGVRAGRGFVTLSNGHMPTSQTPGRRLKAPARGGGRALARRASPLIPGRGKLCGLQDAVVALLGRGHGSPLLSPDQGR